MFLLSRMLNQDLKNMLSETEEAKAELVDEIGAVWLVVKPADEDELDDIMGEHTIPEIIQMVTGGMDPSTIVGYFKNQGKAKKAAQDLLDARDEDMKTAAVEHSYQDVQIAGKDWKKVLSAAKIGDEPMRSPTGWKWMGAGIQITSSNDPVSGEDYDRNYDGEAMPDRAGQVSIEGSEELVQKVVDTIERLGKVS